MSVNIQKENNNRKLGIPFLLLMSIIVIEYSGVGYRYFPPLKQLPLPISLFLLLYTFFKYNPIELLKTKQAKIFIAFIILSLLSMLHGFVKNYGWKVAEIQIGYFFLFWNMYFIVNTKYRFDSFARIFVILHLLLAIVNADKFFNPVRMGVFEAGYFMGDGNDFGWSMLVACPFAIYLFFISKTKLSKIIYGTIACLIGIAILGTQSRGAFLALAACTAYYLFFVSKKKLTGFAIVAILAMGALIIVPGHFISRMQTIQTYEEDSSAQGRLAAWSAAIRMAVDNPILGVGAGSYNSAYGRKYRRPDDPVRWISTHSVYFKILGEYGFTGLFLIISILYVTWKQNRQASLEVNKSEDKYTIPRILPESVNMSLIGFSVAGLFLGGVNYPHLSIITALALSMVNIIMLEKKKIQEAALAPGNV